MPDIKTVCVTGMTPSVVLKALYAGKANQIDGLVQERRNSIAIVFLALTHQNILMQLLIFTPYECPALTTAWRKIIS